MVTCQKMIGGSSGSNMHTPPQSSTANISFEDPSFEYFQLHQSSLQSKILRFLDAFLEPFLELFVLERILSHLVTSTIKHFPAPFSEECPTLCVQMF